MKKTILFAAIAAVIGISVYVGVNAHQKDVMSDIQMANVDALVSGESDADGSRYKCYTSTHYEEGASVVICSTCEEKDDATDDLFNRHDWCS